MTVRPFLAMLAAAAAVFPAAALAFGIGLYPDKPVYEYHNRHTGHYLILSDPAEMAQVDAGAAGPGWSRTGYRFTARNETLTKPNVCRFYAPPPTNSHFYTANAAECEFLRTHQTGWLFEKLDFAIDPPANGACHPYGTPIYRVYNNRAARSDSNHRFTHDRAVVEAMVAEGWVDEGIAFCSTGALREAREYLWVGTAKVRPGAECENEVANLGACVALNNLPRLGNFITSWVPPSYVAFDPLYSQRFTDTTGHIGDVNTAQPVQDTDAVAAHSFVQTLPLGSDFGIHLNSIDRLGGAFASINPIYQMPTLVPAVPGAPDLRRFPWRYEHENFLDVTFTVRLRTLRRADPDSHVVGHATLTFKDVASGLTLYVTLGAYGTNSPGDSVGVDSGTGRVIVGTTFRDDPLFGQRIRGEFLRCQADASSGTCSPATGGNFMFRIHRADFARVLQLARALDARLSADPADYLIANFHFNNAVYRDAQVGLYLGQFGIQLHGY